MKGDPRLGQPIFNHNLLHVTETHRMISGSKKTRNSAPLQRGRSNSSIYPNAPFMEYLPTFPYQLIGMIYLLQKKTTKLHPFSQVLWLKIPGRSVQSQVTSCTCQRTSTFCMLFVRLHDTWRPGGKPFSKLPRLSAEANSCEWYDVILNQAGEWPMHSESIKNVYPPLKLT